MVQYVKKHKQVNKMPDGNNIQIPAPTFEIQDKVWFRPFDSFYPAEILARSYNPDSKKWFYKIAGTMSWVPGEQIIERSEPEPEDLPDAATARAFDSLIGN